MEDRLERISRAEKEHWFRLGYRLGKEQEQNRQLWEKLPPHLKLTEGERRLNRIKYSGSTDEKEKDGRKANI